MFIFSPYSKDNGFTLREISATEAEEEKLIVVVKHGRPELKEGRVFEFVNRSKIVDFDAEDYEEGLADLLEALNVQETKTQGAPRKKASKAQRPARSTENNASLSILRQRATNWDSEGRSEQFLLRGKELDEAVPWANFNAEKLTAVEREFLTAALDLENKSHSEPGKREPTKTLYNADAIVKGVRILVTISALGWRIPGVDGLVLRKNERADEYRPAGAFYHDLMNDRGDYASAEKLTALLSDEMQAARTSLGTPTLVTLPADLGRLVLPFAEPNPARLIVTATHEPDGLPARGFMFRNVVKLAALNGIRHLATPIYVAGTIGAYTALMQMLEALEEISDFGSLEQITLLTLTADIVDRAQKYFAEKGAKPARRRKPARMRLAARAAANRLVNNRAQAIANDDARGEDKLGIADEVNALADTLMLREVGPPLAVGIMGGWGSGKSFVMNLIRKRAVETRAKPIRKGWHDSNKGNDLEVPVFVGHIYQIEFHAWTYAKANLWASLMHTVFFELNRQMRLERLLAYKDFPKGSTPTPADVRAKMMQGEDVRLIERIFRRETDFSLDPAFASWSENIAHWADVLLDKSSLWEVMRNKQSKRYQELLQVNEQAKKLKVTRAQYADEWGQKSTRARRQSESKLNNKTSDKVRGLVRFVSRNFK